MSKLLIVFAALILFVPVCASGASICEAVPNNLAVNCGFETGTFAGWTQSGDLSATFVTNIPTYVHSGTYGAALGPVFSEGHLSQTQLLPTVANTYYHVSFYLYNDGGLQNNFSVTWDNAPFVALVSQDQFPWTRYSADLEATSNATPLEFTFLQVPAYWGLDDVVVQGARSSVPDGGMTLMLLGGVLVGLETLRRKLRA